jgi:2-acylglycerol O-acyltransferase 2
MAAVISAPLSAEPANPIDRENNNLPPKSYADAVEEDPAVSDGNATNGTEHVNGTNGELAPTEVNGFSNGGHMASVLRITDTGSAKKQEKPEENIHSSNDEATAEEYSATVCPSISATFSIH